MNLKTCLEIGSSCGLNTVGECISNIDINSLSLFDYKSRDFELSELFEEKEKYCKRFNISEMSSTLSTLDLIKSEINGELGCADRLEKYCYSSEPCKYRGESKVLLNKKNKLYKVNICNAFTMSNGEITSCSGSSILNLVEKCKEKPLKIGDFVWFTRTFNQMFLRGEGRLVSDSGNKPTRFKIVSVVQTSKGVLYQTKKGHFPDTWVNNIVFRTEEEAINKLNGIG